MPGLLDRLSARGRTATAATAAGAEARVEANVSGRLAVGENILQVHAEHGAVITVATPEDRPVPRRRTPPPRVLPRDFPDLVGRETELRQALDGLADGGPVELSGPAGSGKTSVLRHVAHRRPGKHAAVVHHAVAGEPLEDVLQILFESVYETDRPLKPTAAELRTLLADVPALVLLDDSELERDALTELLDFLPAATVLVTAAGRRLWGEGRAVTLAGLPEEAALALFEQTLGRPLVKAEREPALSVCRALGGHPLRVLQAAALVAGGRADPGALAAAEDPPAAVEHAVIEGLDEVERPVAGLLAAAGGAAVRTTDVAAITGVRDAASVLAGLERRGVAVSHSPAYSLTLGLGAVLAPEGWLAPAIEHFAARARQARRRPREAVADAGLMVRLMESATGRGRWDDVIRLARAIDPALAVGARWGLWDRVLRMAGQAARATKDPAAEAWSLHQIGSRALCLGQAGLARRSLTQALEMREKLGDHEGAEFTRHNLGVLDATGPTPPPAARPPRTRWPWIAGGLAALVAIAVVALVVSGGGKSESTELAGPDGVDFGKVLRGGGSSSRALKLTNTGKAPLTLRTISIEGPTDFRVASDACSGERLAGGEDCAVILLFKPVASGPRSATLTARPRASGGSVKVALEGQGVRPPPPGGPRVALDPPSVAFGAAPGETSPAQSLSVTNTGRAPLTVTGVRVEGSQAFTATTTCTKAPIAAGGACAIAITFAPPAGTTPGTLAATLILDADTPTPPSAALSGTVAEPPVVRLDPGTLSLKADPGASSAPHKITVTNAGQAPLRVLSAHIEGSAAGVVTLSTDCVGAEVDAQAACSVDVVFHAPADAKAGTDYLGRLILEDNAPDGPTTVLSATVTTPPVR